MAFLSLDHIKMSRRSSLTRNHVEDLMIIRINTTNKIEKFAAHKYAKEFVNNGHIRSDDSRWTTDRPNSVLQEENEKKMFLPRLSFL